MTQNSMIKKTRYLLLIYLDYIKKVLFSFEMPVCPLSSPVGINVIPFFLQLRSCQVGLYPTSP
jgi:hypothetical protein